ncbi:MAG: hypothetical protein R3E89_17975 [Thiolinea sp.]
MSVAVLSKRRSGQSERPPIEMGLIMSGRFDQVDQQAIYQARDAVKNFLSQQFPEFAWEMPLVPREEMAANLRHEPSALLEDGSQIREAREWDYAFVITSADLKARYKPYALAALSNALDAAVISTSRIDPQSYQPGLATSERLHLLANRLQVLLLHAFGHLNGLEHQDSAPPHLLTDLQSADGLDAVQFSHRNNVRRCVATCTRLPTCAWKNRKPPSAFPSCVFTCTRPGSTATKSSTPSAMPAPGNFRPGWRACQRQQCPLPWCCCSPQKSGIWH